MEPSCSSNMGAAPTMNNICNIPHRDDPPLSTAAPSEIPSVLVNTTAAELSMSLSATYNNKTSTTTGKSNGGPLTTTSTAVLKPSPITLQSPLQTIYSNTTIGKNGYGVIDSRNNNNHIAALRTFLPDAYHHQQMQMQLQQQYEQHYQIQTYYQRQHQQKLSEFFESRMLNDAQRLAMSQQQHTQQKPIFNINRQSIAYHDGHYHSHPHSYMHNHHQHLVTSPSLPPTTSIYQQQQRQKYIVSTAVFPPTVASTSSHPSSLGITLNTAKNLNLVKASSGINGDGGAIYTMNLNNYIPQSATVAQVGAVCRTSTTPPLSSISSISASSNTLHISPSSSTSIVSSGRTSNVTTAASTVPTTAVAVVSSSPMQSCNVQGQQKQQQRYCYQHHHQQHQQQQQHQHQYHHHHHNHFAQLGTNYRQQL